MGKTWTISDSGFYFFRAVNAAGDTTNDINEGVPADAKYWSIFLQAPPISFSVEYIERIERPEGWFTTLRYAGEFGCYSVPQPDLEDTVLRTFFKYNWETYTYGDSNGTPGCPITLLSGAKSTLAYRSQCEYGLCTESIKNNPCNSSGFDCFHDTEPYDQTTGFGVFVIDPSNDPQNQACGVGFVSPPTPPAPTLTVNRCSS